MNKAYPQFNLTTLQLPAPASNLTKAEYKDTYGIDLDEVNIKAFKLVLFGSEKYHIDQIKEVEDGYEIYFNGHILSITDIVQTSNEVYNIENAKPIYCHPICVIDSTEGIEKRLTMLIFNNSSSPFTLNTLKAFIDSLGLSTSYNGKIMVSGGFHYNNKVIVASYLTKFNSNLYALVGVDVADGTAISIQTSSFSTIFPDSVTFDDGVNKIN